MFFGVITMYIHYIHLCFFWYLKFVTQILHHVIDIWYVIQRFQRHSPGYGLSGHTLPRV